MSLTAVQEIDEAKGDNRSNAHIIRDWSHIAEQLKEGMEARGRRDKEKKNEQIRKETAEDTTFPRVSAIPSPGSQGNLKAAPAFQDQQ
ncbi:hypothetical protein NQZ68_013500 [Dissostichus eleginoides]|nr:hypothetical protein NQZ68_013500 [Dissostichus eleginoides]